MLCAFRVCAPVQMTEPPDSSTLYAQNLATGRGGRIRHGSSKKTAKRFLRTHKVIQVDSVCQTKMGRLVWFWYNENNDRDWLIVMRSRKIGGGLCVRLALIERPLKFLNRHRPPDQVPLEARAPSLHKRLVLEISLDTLSNQFHL